MHEDDTEGRDEVTSEWWCISYMYTSLADRKKNGLTGRHVPEFEGTSLGRQNSRYRVQVDLVLLMPFLLGPQ